MAHLWQQQQLQPFCDGFPQSVAKECLTILSDEHLQGQALVLIREAWLCSLHSDPS